MPVTGSLRLQFRVWVWHLARIVSAQHSSFAWVCLSLVSLSRVQLLQVVESFVIAKWTSMVTTRFAVTMDPRFCFVTTAFATFLATRHGAAGLSTVVIEKKNQVEGSNVKPGDITVQHYHRGFASVSHPLQKKYLILR